VFIGSIPAFPACHAQGKTQEGMLKNIKEVLRLCVRNADKKFSDNANTAILI